MDLLSMSGIIIFLLVAFLPAIIGYKMAKTRNRSTFIWALLCFFGSWLFMFILFCLGPVDNRKRKPCPKCSERVLADAKLCPFCKTDL